MLSAGSDAFVLDMGRRELDAAPRIGPADFATAEGQARRGEMTGRVRGYTGLIGGAVITEQVFGWKGMGELFATGLRDVDPMPVMAFFLVTGTAAVLMNLVADVLYAVLDPRIRV